MGGALAGLIWAQASTAEREQLQSKILQALLNDPELGQYPMAAGVGQDRKVVLNGVVPSKSDREAAARLVKSVTGVAGVDNQIKVNRAAAALPPTATPAGPAAPTNDDVHAVIQNAMTAQAELRDVSVAVNFDEVTLTGTVPSKQAKKQAEQIARDNAESRKVVNDLRVKKPKPARPGG